MGKGDRIRCSCSLQDQSWILEREEEDGKLEGQWEQQKAKDRSKEAARIGDSRKQRSLGKKFEYTETDTYLRVAILVCISVHAANYSKTPVAGQSTESNSLLLLVLEAEKWATFWLIPCCSLMWKGQETCIASLFISVLIQPTRAQTTSSRHLAKAAFPMSQFQHRNSVFLLVYWDRVLPGLELVDWLWLELLGNLPVCSF